MAILRRIHFLDPPQRRKSADGHHDGPALVSGPESKLRLRLKQQNPRDNRENPKALPPDITPHGLEKPETNVLTLPSPHPCDKMGDATLRRCSEDSL